MIPSYPAPLATAERALRHVFVRDLMLGAHIGVHEAEKGHPQRIRVNLDLAVSESLTEIEDDLANVVCYERMATNIRRIVADGHMNLVETLAERIAAMSLEDSRVRRVRVRVEKLEAIADSASVGVEIERVPTLI
jgi:dihydroneopterin aldolase